MARAQPAGCGGAAERTSAAAATAGGTGAGGQARRHVRPVTLRTSPLRPASQPARRRSEDSVRRRAGAATVAERRCPQSGAVHAAARGALRAAAAAAPQAAAGACRRTRRHAVAYAALPCYNSATPHTQPPRRSRRPCASRGAACRPRFALPARSFRSSAHLKWQRCRARRRCAARIDRAGRRRCALSSMISSVCYCCDPASPRSVTIPCASWVVRCAAPCCGPAAASDAAKPAQAHVAHALSW